MLLQGESKATLRCPKSALEGVKEVTRGARSRYRRDFTHVNNIRAFLDRCHFGSRTRLPRPWGSPCGHGLERGSRKPSFVPHPHAAFLRLAWWRRHTAGLAA